MFEYKTIGTPSEQRIWLEHRIRVYQTKLNLLKNYGYRLQNDINGHVGLLYVSDYDNTADIQNLQGIHDNIQNEINSLRS